MLDPSNGETFASIPRSRASDIARSVQAMYEEAFFHLLNTLHRRHGLDAVAIAGGCGMKIDLAKVIWKGDTAGRSDAALLFSESASRLLVTVHPEQHAHDCSSDYT